MSIGNEKNQFSLYTIIIVPQLMLTHLCATVNGGVPVV